MRIMRQLVALLAFATVAASTAADEPSRAEKIISKADKDLAAEANKLLLAGKQAEANDVLKISQALTDYVVPLNKPGDAAKLRTKLFAQKIVGSWERHSSPDRYEFLPDGIAIGRGPTGNEVVRGKIRIVSPDQAEVTWNNGFIWTVFLAGSSRLAVDEKQGGDFTNDGIVLSRQR
jgi:hypothetical protein